MFVFKRVIMLFAVVPLIGFFARYFLVRTAPAKEWVSVFCFIFR